MKKLEVKKLGGHEKTGSKNFHMDMENVLDKILINYQYMKSNIVTWLMI